MAEDEAPKDPPDEKRRPANRRRKRQVVRSVRRGLAVAFVAGAIGLLVYAWLPKPIPVETARVTRGTLEVTVNEDGRARVKDRYVVSAPLAGNLARIELNPGDQVERGQLLARIVPLSAPLLDVRSRRAAEASVSAASAALRQARAQIERAEVAADYAKSDLARERELARRGSISPAALERAELEARSRAAELASAKFGARVAEHEYEMAKIALGRHDGGKPTEEQLEIPSPITGRVLKVIQKSEGAVQVGAPLLELGDPKALEVVVDVLTSDAVQIQPNAHARLERWGGPPLEARVRLVEPSAFTRLSSLGVEEQRVNTILDIQEPYVKWSALGDGYRVEAKITTWREEGVTKLPASALFRHGDGWAAFVVRDGRATLSLLRVGARNAFEAQIESGANVGDTVIVHPGDRIADGVDVRAR